MKLQRFEVESYMTLHENNCRYNLADTVAKSLTLKELLAYDKKDSLEDLMNLSLDYGAIEGSHELKKGILSLYQSGDDEEIAICHGGVNANELVLMTLLSTNDHILSFLPTYQQLYSFPESLGVEVDFIHLKEENEWKIDFEELEKNIRELGNKVDVWFITHPHSDHAGAFIKLIRDTNISVGKVYYTMNEIEWYKQYAVERAIEAEEFENALQNERIKDKVEEVSINEVINIDFIKCEILGVKNPEITNDAFNNSSMVIKMLLPNTSILFLGDTGVESGEKLISTQKEKLKSDIVQVAHHGQNGANEDLYKEIQPKICLWPTPEWIWNNDNGEGENTGPWKTFETRKWIEDLGVKQNIIEKDGDITITIK